MLTNPFLHWLDRLYSFVIKIGSNLQSLFILYMRLTWGHQLFLIGIAKLQSIDATIALLTSLGFPYPAFHAYGIGIVETVCGFLLFIGLLSRLAAIPVICAMLTALSTAHAPELSNFRFLFEPMKLVVQEPYPFLIMALIVFVFGPGRISIDAWIKRWVDRQPRY